ncbi:hypothetical protein PMI35_01144, partial [Pseudomonas sp. GM78]
MDGESLMRRQEGQKPLQQRCGLTADLIGSRTQFPVGARLAGEPGAAVCLLYRV